MKLIAIVFLTTILVMFLASLGGCEVLKGKRSSKVDSVYVSRTDTIHLVKTETSNKSDSSWWREVISFMPKGGDTTLIRTTVPVNNYYPTQIFLMGGQNDLGATLGTITDATYTGPEVYSNPPTFYAAYKGVLEKLINQNQMLTNNRIRQDYANQNAGIKNQAAYYNAGIGDRETIANLANQAQSRNLKSSAYTNIGQNIMGQYRDVQAQKANEKYNQSMANSQDEYLKIILAKYPEIGKDPELAKMYSSK